MGIVWVPTIDMPVCIVKPTLLPKNSNKYVILSHYIVAADH